MAERRVVRRVPKKQGAKKPPARKGFSTYRSTEWEEKFDDLRSEVAELYNKMNRLWAEYTKDKATAFYGKGKK